MRTASRILRRSGESVVQMCGLLEWTPDVVVQAGVGLYHGEVSAMMDAWKSCRFVGVEPHPATYELLRENYPGPILNYALGSERKDNIVLHSKPHHKDGSSLHELPDCIPIIVQQRTIDELLYDAYDFKRMNTLFWVDCEGSENDVLLGAKHLIKLVDMVNVELTGKPYAKSWSSPLAIHRYLDEAGFLLQWTHTHRPTIGQADAIYVRPQLFKAEYCSCPYTLEKVNGRD